jgi:hypothetical protein
MSIDSRLRERILRLGGDPAAEIPGGPFGRDAAVSPIAGGGSDRGFYRIAEPPRSAVVLHEPGAAEELKRYIAIGDFLREDGIPVPAFFASDDEARLLLMEDLGDRRLDETLVGLGPEEELSFYRECVGILVRLQTSVTRRMIERGILADRLFTVDLLLGETEYFEREMVRRYAGLEPPPGWNDERRRLAEAVAAQPVVFMHRDFQSRNIMVRDGIPRIVDFQTAYRGPALYDAASLLKDPYHPLPAGTRKTLKMELYYRLTDHGFSVDGGFEGYREQFTLAGLQRNMQALAAFAFLGDVKGKPEFLRSIPSGLDLLEEGLAESGRFPAIASLAAMIRDHISERT